MENILTSQLFSTIRHSAFLDELEKIAEDRLEKSQQFKKWLKNTALIAAGTGVGTGTVMVGEKVLNHALGDKWRSLPPKTRMAIAAPIASAAGMGAMLFLQKLNEEKSK